MLIMQSQVDVQKSTVTSLSQKWDEHATEIEEKQKLNPFSGTYEADNRLRWVKGEPGYAQPVGTTAERGERAKKYINNEMSTLLRVIDALAKKTRDGSRTVTFGQLFNRYTSISSNLVGILIRARKRHLLDFEGEMLWQRQDDDVIITLCEGALE